VQVYNNDMISSIWKNYTANATNLHESISLLSKGLKNAQEQNPSEISLSQALRLKHRNISAAASETESQINSLQTTQAWLQKAQTILEEMSVAVTPADEDDVTENGDEKAQIMERLELMREELARIQQKNDGQIFAGKTAPDTAAQSASWFSVVCDPDNTPFAGDGSDRLLAATRDGIADLAGKRKVIGDHIQNLESILAELHSQVANIRATENQIRNPDLAMETTQTAKGSIMTQVGTAMLAQANALPRSVLNLTAPAEG